MPSSMYSRPVVCVLYGRVRLWPVVLALVCLCGSAAYPEDNTTKIQELRQQIAELDRARSAAAIAHQAKEKTRQLNHEAERLQLVAKIKAVKDDLHLHATDCDYQQAIRRGDKNFDSREHFEHVRKMQALLAQLERQLLLFPRFIGESFSASEYFTKQNQLRAQIADLEREESRKKNDAFLKQMTITLPAPIAQPANRSAAEAKRPAPVPRFEEPAYTPPVQATAGLGNSTSPKQPEPLKWTFAEPPVPGFSDEPILGESLPPTSSTGNYFETLSQQVGSGWRKTTWQPNGDNTPQAIYVTPSGAILNGYGVPVTGYDAFAIKDMLQTQAETYRAERELAYVRSSEDAIYQRAIKDWEDRFQAGMATYRDHPDKLFSSSSPQPQVGMTESGKKAAIYFEEKKLRDAKTIRDIQPSGQTGPDKARINFSTDQEAYVHAFANTIAVELAIAQQRTVEGIVDTDPKYRKAVEALRLTQEELKLKYSSHQSNSSDSVLKKVLDNSRVDYWQRNKHTYGGIPKHAAEYSGETSSKAAKGTSVGPAKDASPLDRINSALDALGAKPAK